MPTNVIHAVVLSATWLTNAIETPAVGVREWYRTNIVSLATVVAVVGPGIPGVVYTNAPVAVSTNVRRFEIVETIVAAPVVSMVVTSQWPAVIAPPPQSVLTPLTDAEASARGLPIIKQ